MPYAMDEQKEASELLYTLAKEFAGSVAGDYETPSASRIAKAWATATCPDTMVYLLFHASRDGWPPLREAQDLLNAYFDAHGTGYSAESRAERLACCDAIRAAVPIDAKRLYRGKLL